METTTPAARKLILPLAFALTCVVLTLSVFHSFGGALPLEAKGYRINVPLQTPLNLVQGSNVQIAGVKVGKIVDVQRRGNEAVATLQLGAQYAPLHAGARVIARTKTLLGESYLEIAPGPSNAKPVPDGGSLASSQVQPSVQLDQFLSTFDRPTRLRTQNLFSGLARALDGRAHAFNNSLGWTAPLSAGLDGVLGTLNAQKADLQRLLAGSADVLRALGRREGVLQAAVKSGNEVLDVTAERNQALAATVDALPAFLRELRATSDTIAAESPALNAAVAALRPVAPLVRPTLDEIRADAPQFRRLFLRLPATIAAGERGLPTLPGILDAARSGFQGFYPTARELIPIAQLVAANPTAPAAPFAAVASVTGGTFVGPGGLVLHAATGLPTVWNETLGGWLKRLPTNVMNPYVKPGGLDDIAKLGYVKAFDCRNVHNRPYLPATGSGSPPCVLQGPWTFNGKSAFYPRLELAAP
jgi:virulence factor Mce-like protein